MIHLLHCYAGHFQLFQFHFASIHIAIDQRNFERWRLRHLQHRSRFKNPSFTSFFMMFIMPIFFYIGRWRYFPLPLFPTLNLRHYRVPEFGINPKVYSRNILILPKLSSTKQIFPYLTWKRRTTSWTTYYATIFLNHTNMLQPHHLMLFRILRNYRLRHLPPRNANRKPRQLPKLLPNDVALNRSHRHVLLALRHPGLLRKSRNFEP